MGWPNLLKNLVAAATLVVVAVVFCGCPAAGEKGGKSDAKQGEKGEKAEKTKTPDQSETAESASKSPSSTETEPADAGLASNSTNEGGKTPTLGNELKAEPVPLVDNIKDWKKFDPCSPAWIDAKHKEFLIVGETCKAGYPLEFFATLRDRGYESVVVVNTKASIAHAALLVLGAKPGHPVRFGKDGKEYEPPTGTEILIEVRWKDKDGKVKKAPAKQWVRNIQTKKALDVNWVFAGSMFVKDSNGQEHYVADGGNFVSVSNLAGAMLDLPIRSKRALDARSFEGFVENMPPEKTPVTIIFKPKLEKKTGGEADAAMEKWMQEVQKPGKGSANSGPESVLPQPDENPEKPDKAGE